MMANARYLAGLAVLAALALSWPGPSAMAQNTSVERANALQVTIREPGDGPVSESMTLPLGQAAVIFICLFMQPM